MWRGWVRFLQLLYHGRVIRAIGSERWTVKNSWAIWAEMGLLCITFFFFFFDFIVLL